MSMRLAQQVEQEANRLVPMLVVIRIDRQEEVEKWAYNDIHFEVMKFLDRIRQNEGFESFCMRKDNDKAMVMEVGFTKHAAEMAIIRELTTRASNVANRHGIKGIRVFVDEGVSGNLEAALEMKKVARSLRLACRR